MNIPLTIAVIPGLPASARTVSEASRRGIEMLLHQPMEPREEGGKNPGEGVLLTSMAAGELRAQVRTNLAAVPGAVGVNNHMGSKFTEDAAGLGALMAEIKEHGLFWLDSRTTPGTRGAEAALAAGVPALERDIFIDAEVNADFIRRQVRRLVERARVHGTAVGIGHPHLETIAVLRELRGELLASGVTLVPVAALVRKTPEIETGTALAAAQADTGEAGSPRTTGKQRHHEKNGGGHAGHAHPRHRDIVRRNRGRGGGEGPPRALFRHRLANRRPPALWRRSAGDRRAQTSGEPRPGRAVRARSKPG